MKSVQPIFPDRFKKTGINESNYLEHEGYPIDSFIDLRLAVAELSCVYPDSILFFRGQTQDHKRKYGAKGVSSTFLPSIYRGQPHANELKRRWERLELATNLLTKYLRKLSDSNKQEFQFLLNKKLAQWSVLQHYEIVDTPLLDVTQSLRVACSFADLGRHSEFAYIYVFALPYPTGRISINSEHYLTNIRLLSVVPSIVRRPHNQEGFLIGEDDIALSKYVSDTFDFRRRAIAKFKIHIGGSNFWKITDNLSDRPLSRQELYPDETLEGEEDILYSLCGKIKNELNMFIPTDSNSSGESFLILWQKIELYMLAYCFEMGHKSRPTVAKGIKMLTNFSNSEKILRLIYDLKKLHNMRNSFIHIGVNTINLEEAIFLANSIIARLDSEIPGIKDMVYFFQKYRNDK